MSAKETLIKVEKLQKYYKGGAIKALDGINTEIKKGEVVVVIGPSGSGKSTFLRCLNLLEVPTGGHILFEGTDITDEKTNINLHRQKMGMVFQHFNLFPHMTILKNMTIKPFLELLGKRARQRQQKRRWSCSSVLAWRTERMPISAFQADRACTICMRCMEPEVMLLTSHLARPRNDRRGFGYYKQLANDSMTMVAGNTRIKLRRVAHA